jgi:hypothetical protein
MSGVLLAILVFTVVLVAHLAFSHLARPSRKERTLIGFMIGAIVLAVVAYPMALPVLIRLTGPPSLPQIVDAGAGLATMGFLVLGYVEFWSIIERSFSLRLLIDLAEAPEGLTRDEIAARYSVGRGLQWLMEKRISDLIGSGMAQHTGARLGLTSRGHLVGILFGVTRRAFLMR